MIISLVLHHKIEKEKTLAPNTSAMTVDNQSNCNEKGCTVIVVK
jgi:hypothetical protein